MFDSTAPERPNFLIFITDQHNPYCFGYAGHPVVRTPNLDQLAASGVAFSRCYTPQPLCMPARASLFTGLTPRGHRVRMNGIPLDPTIPTFTEALRVASYQTHCCGKIHLHINASPKGIPLDELDPAEYPECGALWNNGVLTDLPIPYYGLESADYASGHGHNSFGHYVNWLREQYPHEAKLFFAKTPLESPSPAYDLFNRSSYKWALPAELHPTAWIADRTIDFLNAAGDRHKTAPANQHPFMLMCSIQDPHPPFAPPAPYCYRYDPADVPPPKTGAKLDSLPPHFRAVREMAIRTSGNHSQPMQATAPYYAECAAHYFGLVEMLDDQIGRVMATLHANGLAENTVVMFISDHGEALGAHGLWGKGPYHIDDVVRVPFILSWPGRIPSGLQHDGVVSLLDIAPTVLTMAGVDIPLGLTPASPEAVDAPSPWPGRNLIPVLNGENDDPEATALVEMDEDYLGLKLRTLVTKHYRLTVYSGQDYGELFDLQNDPHEQHNLWNVPAFEALRHELHRQLLHKIMLTDISLPRQLSRA